MGRLSYKQWKKMQGDSGSLANMLLAQWKLVFTNVFVWDTESTGNKDLGRHIENYLYELGSCVFFKTPEGIYGALPYVTQDKVNWYGEVDSWKVMGAGGPVGNFNIDNSVMMLNNSEKISYFAYTHNQVNRLVDIEGTIDVNVNQLKVPIVFSGTEDSLLTFKNIYKKIVKNEPVIYTDRKVNLQTDFTGIPTNANYHGQELMQLYNDIEGRLLKIAGLKYVHTEKKERLVVDEVNSNDGLSNTFLFSALNERQKAVEKINEMFGLNITVEINPLLKQSDPDKDEQHGEEGDNHDE